MASRQEEKEQRRRERLEREQSEQRAAARRRRAQLIFGGLLGLALIAAIAVGIASGVGGDDDGGATDGGRAPDATANVELPAPEITDFEEAAEAAGCDLQHPANEGGGHAEQQFKASDYGTNPPTSGTHTPDWYEDGIYEPGGTPELGKLVHTLEHGRINIQYAPGTPKKTVEQLEAFAAEKTGYHILLYENATDMPYAVAATAWNQLLGCEEMNPKVFDALRTFYDRYVDKGPERVP